MTSENINLTEQLSPQFEGFFLKTSICKNSQELEERLDHHFSLELEVQPIDSQSTSFDVGNQNLNLTAHEAWKLTYQIRELQDIAYVEPLFAISIDGRPDWTEEIVLPDEEQGVETFLIGKRHLPDKEASLATQIQDIVFTPRLKTIYY